MSDILLSDLSHLTIKMTFLATKLITYLVYNTQIIKSVVLCDLCHSITT